LHRIVLILGLDWSISIKDIEGHIARFLAGLFHLFLEFRSHILSMDIPGKSCGDNNAIASAFGNKIFHPLELAHVLIGQKEPNLYRPCCVTGGGILVLFNVLFTIRIFALILPPPFFFRGVIKSIVFKAIIRRLFVFKIRSWSAKKYQYSSQFFGIICSLFVTVTKGKESALLRLRDIRPPPFFSSPLFILVIKIDFFVDFGEVFIRKRKKRRERPEI
jgi:hypothetical protein